MLPHSLFGSILDDRLKEKLLKPWKGAHSSHFRVCVCVCVCVSVYTRATEHSFWPRNIFFGLSDPWDMRKKLTYFSVFRIFRFLPLCNTSKFFVSSYRSHCFTYIRQIFQLHQNWYIERKKTLFWENKLGTFNLTGKRKLIFVT